MEQCGGDEEFLHELLGDLRNELNAQIKKIELAMNPVLLLNIRSAAHVVKGAAGNLMCEKLRLAAYNLEMVAKNAPQDVPVSAELVAELNQRFHEFKLAAVDMNNFVESIQQRP